MEAPIKFLCLVGVVVVLVGTAGIHGVEGAGGCGRNTTPDNETIKLAPCATVAQDENASVSQSCCAQLKKLGQNPSCLCSVLLSNTAKNSGVNPQIAITIPKRCNFADRPVGYKCGPFPPKRKLEDPFNIAADPNSTSCFPSPLLHRRRHPTTVVRLRQQPTTPRHPPKQT